MNGGRWVVAALVITLTGCQAGERPSGDGPEPPVETRAMSDWPSDAPGQGVGTSAPGFDIPAPGRTEPGSRRTPGAPSPRVHQARQEVCDEVGAGQALRLSTSNPAAARVLDQWDACVRTDTAPAYTWLHNRTRAVWTLQEVPWAIVQEHRPSRTRLGAVHSGVFHRAAEERGKSPNAWAFIHPGESLWIAAEPDEISWHADLPLTVAWAGAGEIIHRLDSHGRQLLTESVARRDAEPSVAVTCVLALHDYAQDRTDLRRAELKEVLRDGFEGMLADEDCAEAARETTIAHREGRTISVLEDVLRVIPGSGTTLDEISEGLEPYAGINGIITLEPAGPATG